MKALRKTLMLDKGLQPDAAMIMNSTWLRQAKGMYRGLAGLELEPSITAKWDATASWPFPQVLNLRRELILCGETTIQRVNADWSLTTLKSGVTAAEFWQVVDFGDVYYLASGKQVFIRNVTEETLVEVTYSAFPKVATFCRFKGQIVGGNALVAFQDADERFALWSGIGRSSFIPDWKNEAGWMDLEIGTIQLCESFQDQMVIFYGTEGIAGLYPAQNTFGYQKISELGLLSDYSAGFGDVHIAILQDGALWQFTSEGMTPLGYKDYLSLLDPDGIRISYDYRHKAFYITDGLISYIFANGHLTEGNTKPTSIIMLDGTLLAPTKQLGAAAVLLETAWQDLNLVGMKSVEFLELGMLCDGAVQATSRVNYNLGVKEQLVPWKPVNESGYCYVSGTGNKFTLLVKLISGSLFRLDYITYGVKLSDNRIQNQLQTISDRSWDAS